MNNTDEKIKGRRGETGVPATEIEEDASRAADAPCPESEPVTMTREEYDALVAEGARFKEQYLLAVADFDNFRKRVEKEKQDIVCFANERLISELLPILDNLERALSMELDKAGMDSVLQGVRMVSDQLHAVLGVCGLEPVKSVGDIFDPRYHEAVGVLQSPDHDEGTVVLELQKGYKLKGRTLRPSIVHVAGPRKNSNGNGNEGDI